MKIKIKNNPPLITIFTPAYNRRNLLPRLYTSLKNQTSKNFVWLIIDDGSVDGTEKWVEDIKQEDTIDVKYIKKTNGGKHTAYNLACQVADTELFFIAMDSDDQLTSKAVEEIEKCWEKCKNDKEIEGMVFLCEDPSGKMLYSYYDTIQLNKNPSWKAAYVNGWFWGEAEYILRTTYAREFLYPEYDNEKFFNEAYTYMQMDGKLVWNKRSIYIRDYQKEGLTNNFLKSVFKSPLGYADYNKIRMNIVKNKKLLIKAVLFYDIFSILGKRKHIVKEASVQWLSTLMLPLSVVIALILKIKFRGC